MDVEPANLGVKGIGLLTNQVSAGRLAHSPSGDSAVGRQIDVRYNVAV
jgi:hypothetical protein